MSTASQSEIRRRALIARRDLDVEVRSLASRRIATTFLNSHYFYRAARIGCYISMPDEVATSDMFARAWLASKRIYCPVVASRRRLRFVEVTRESRLERSKFGLFEPVDGDEILPLELDVVIVPVVAFDGAGHRIGMGGGYYDTTFSALGRCRNSLHPKLVGVAFNCQKVPKIKANPWDIALSDVLTEAS